ncbi:MAG: BatA domain-containing protein [Opitutaceae bacterium]|jgi:hypothetical protein
MSFLAPLFLFGALAVAGPVIFHLIRRTTRERTTFSSVMFLPPSAPRLTRRSRLEHILLLLLRCLAIGLLALGFSRPFFRSAAPDAGSPAQSRRIVVLVDVSASMRRSGLWDAARERAAGILRAVGPGDEASVYLFSRKAAPLVSFEQWKGAPPGERAPLAMARLAASGPGWEDDHLGDALVTAAEALADTATEKKAQGPRQIFLISDLKAGSKLDSLQSYDWPKNIELRVEALKARNPTNAGLQLVADSPDADRLATPSIRVRVSNSAESAREQFQVGWSRAADGAFIGAPIDVYVPPGQSRVVPVPVLPNAAEMRQIHLRGDDEDFDNTAYVVPPVKQQWNVLYFGSDAADDSHGPLFFLERALPDDPRLSVKALERSPSAAVPPAEMQDAKLYFVTDSLAPETALGLRAQMLAGKTVVFAPRSAQSAGTLGRMLELEGPGLEDAQPTDYAMFGDIDFRHPLFAPFSDPHYSDFTKIHIWKYRRLNAAAIPAARVLAKFDSGDPAVVEVPVGAGRLLVLLTGWNPDDSQLAVSSKFVPLVYSVLDLAGGLSERATQYQVGDAIPLDPAAGAAAETTVTLPDGSTATLPPGAQSYGGAVQPGIYQLSSATRSFRVGVNVAASESRTEPLSPDELERYGAPGPQSQPEAARTAQRQVLLRGEEAEGRQKLWRWILGATLAVLLIESALAGWTARQSGDTLPQGTTPT